MLPEIHPTCSSIQLVSAKNMLFRAQSIHRLIQGHSGEFENPNIARPRRPRDTELALHGVVGQWMEKNFQLNYRERSLFCTGRQDIAASYATAGYALIEIWPVEDYSLCVSHKVSDMFAYFQFNPDAAISSLSIEAALDEFEFREFKNHGLEDAAKTGCEVMLFAERYAYKRIS
jgi:hypothetical protein